MSELIVCFVKGKSNVPGTAAAYPNYGSSYHLYRSGATRNHSGGWLVNFTLKPAKPPMKTVATIVYQSDTAFCDLLLILTTNLLN